VSEIKHPNYKFLVVNVYNVLILNTTVADDPIPEYDTATELSKVVPAYIPQDEK
jgi:hypothetical protein